MMESILLKEQVKDALRVIIAKFDNDLYSLSLAILYLGYPGITVNDLRQFLNSVGKNGELVTKSQTTFYKTQLNQLQRWTLMEEHILEIFGKYVVKKNWRVKALLSELLNK